MGGVLGELETGTVCHRGFVSLLAMEAVRVPDEVVVGTEHERALAPVLTVTFVNGEHAVILKRLTEFGFRLGVWHDVVGWRDGWANRVDSALHHNLDLSPCVALAGVDFASEGCSTPGSTA